MPRTSNYRSLKPSQRHNAAKQAARKLCAALTLSDAQQLDLKHVLYRLGMNPERAILIVTLGGLTTLLTCDTQSLSTLNYHLAHDGQCYGLKAGEFAALSAGEAVAYFKHLPAYARLTLLPQPERIVVAFEGTDVQKPQQLWPSDPLYLEAQALLRQLPPYPFEAAQHLRCQHHQHDVAQFARRVYRRS